MREPGTLDLLALAFINFVIPFTLGIIWEKLTNLTQKRPWTWKETGQKARFLLILGGFLSGLYCSVVLDSGVIGFLWFILLDIVLGFVFFTKKGNQE